MGKQTFKITTIFAIAPLMFFVFSPFASAALYGYIKANLKSDSVTVIQGQKFDLAVEGYTDQGRVIKEVGFSSPRSYSGYSSDGHNWYVKNCGSSGTTCSLTWNISELSPGTYIYTGKVVDNNSDPKEAEKLTRNNVTVTVVATQGASGQTSQTSQTNQTNQTNQQSGQSNCPPGTPPGTICLENPLSVDTFDALLNIIINFILWVGITVAPVIFIIAGFLFVTSAGDAKKLETAKHMMLYTVIGLVVLLLARGLVAVLKSVIGVQ